MSNNSEQFIDSNEKKYYDYAYWFEKPKLHENEDNYKEGYYAYEIFKNVLPLLEIPDNGYIVVLGSHNCVSLELLCKIYGSERCIGYDLFNPTNHNRVKIKDCSQLSIEDNIPIAFCHNDLGSFPTTPALKIYGQKWAANNIVKNGVMLSRNNLNSAKFKVEQVMEKKGFKNVMFSELREKNPLNFKNLSEREIEGHMFSIRTSL